MELDITGSTILGDSEALDALVNSGCLNSLLKMNASPLYGMRICSRVEQEILQHESF